MEKTKNESNLQEQTMTVIGCRPGETAKIILIPNTLEGMQQYVGGYIEVIYPYDDPIAIVCNEEGKLNGLELNRALYTEDGQMFDIVAGSMFVCGLGKDNFASIPNELQEKYLEMYKSPEVFIRIGGDIRAIKVQEEKLPQENHQIRHQHL